MDPEPVPDERAALGAVFLVWLCLAAVTSLPYAEAFLRPPPGRTFVGTFYYVDDFYNYLSYVSQAEQGAFLFRNKVVLQDHRPALVNLEWWLVGRLARLAGHRPVLAYRIFGLAAAFFLLLAAERWLHRGGLPPSHRVAGLLLVATGGGMGGVLFHVFGRPAWQCADLLTGLFPFLEVLGNPHFVAGTTLLAWSLWFLGAGTPRGTLWGVLLATALGLVRPYDLVLLVAIHALVVLSTPARGWISRLLPLGALLPVVLYNAYVFYVNPAFKFYAQETYVYPSVPDFLWALGPALLLAALAFAGPTPSATARSARSYLLAWVFLGLALVMVRPGHFWAQFIVGLGLPCLALAALGLGGRRAVWTLAAAALLAPTAATAVAIARAPQPSRFVPAGRLEAAQAFGRVCRTAELALAPADIGLYLAGLSPCRAYSSHPIEPDHRRREADVRAFYESASTSWRARFLDDHCVSHVLLPKSGLIPSSWLGEGTPFREAASVGGVPQTALYSRPGREGCR